MARLPFVDPAQLPDAYQDLTMHQNFQRVYANSPGSMREFMRVTGHVRKNSGLDARLREIAILAVGKAARSNYVFSHHVKTGTEAGVTHDEIVALHSDNKGVFSPKERAVIDLARAMTLHHAVPDETFATVRNALGAQHLMDLLFVIGHYIAMAALIKALDIEIEPGYQQLLAPLGG